MYVHLVSIHYYMAKCLLMLARYMDSVPLIIPLLEKEYRSTTRTLDEINRELRSLVQLKNIFLKPCVLWG